MSDDFERVRLFPPCAPDVPLARRERRVECLRLGWEMVKRRIGNNKDKKKKKPRV